MAVVPVSYWASAARTIGVSPAEWKAHCHHAVSALPHGPWHIVRALPSTVHLTLEVHNDAGAFISKVFAPPESHEDDLLALQTVSGVLKPLEIDETLRTALFRKLEPGDDLSHLVKHGQDAKATRIFCDLYNARQPAQPPDPRFTTIDQQMASLYRHKPAGDSFDQTVHLALQVLQTLSRSAGPRLLHGDLHHFNILRDSQSWTVIDPQGVNAPPVMECGPFLRNPIGLEDLWHAPPIIQERLVILHQEAGISPQTAAMCGLLASAEAAAWDRQRGQQNPPLEQTAAIWASLL